MTAVKLRSENMGQSVVGRFIVITCFLLFCSCSPSYRPLIAVPEIPQMPLSAGGADHQVEVALGEVRDRRASDALVQYEMRSSQALGDLPQTVRAGLLAALERRGFRVDESAPVSISCELKKWQAAIDDGMPSRCKSSATLAIELRDPAGKPMYSSEYSGYSNYEDSNLSIKEIRETLGTAMAEAITQLMNDEQFIALLGSF